MNSMREQGEDAIVARLRRVLPAVDGTVVAGIGEDCAVIRPCPDASDDWLLKSDPVLEGVHFLKTDDPRRIGHKAIARVMSDMAAMGGVPRWFLADVVAPPDESIERLEEIYRGMAVIAARYASMVVGGDLARGPALELHIFGVGLIPRGTAILRSGARPGDSLYVTGALGYSGAGRHLDFEPRLREGQWLAAGRWASAMMDVSDGLGADLPRLAASSGVALELFTEKLPVAQAGGAALDRRSPLEHALNDGEDFELLFTVPAGRTAAFEAAWKESVAVPATRIGAVCAGPPEIRLVDSRGNRFPFRRGGFDHFSS